MQNILNAFYARPLALYLALALVALSTFAVPAEAMLLTTAPGAAQPYANRAADLAQVQTALESKVLQQRLLDYGLTPEETTARLNALSDEQLHQLAANMDSLQPGGDALGALFALTLIAAVVVIIILVLQGKIAIERK